MASTHCRSAAFTVALCAITAFVWAVASLSPESAAADWNGAIAASNPLNWYRLDELTGTTAFDYGSDGLDGTYGSGDSAPARGTAGPVGTGVTFDGDMDTIYLSGGTLTGDWTSEFIVRKNVAADRSSVLIRGVPFTFPSTALKLEQHEAPEQIGYTQFGQVDYVFTPPVYSPLDEFFHLVFVKDDSAVRAYVNGTLAGTRFDPISLYRYQIGDESGESPFASLDDVVIYDRALSPTEIAEHFAAIPEPSTLAIVCVVLGLGCLRRLSRRS
ncbi:MAG: LamG domain-containing protein [Planctomycetales bacterium]|nr:LamG domain-containing protein [Planctomycetales bacterium]